MPKHTIIIDTRTNKTRSLLNLIKEMSKSDKYIKVDPEIPNAETVRAMIEAELGIVTTSKNKQDLFRKLEK